MTKSLRQAVRHLMTVIGIAFPAAVVALTIALSWLATGWTRRFALARNVLDIPNARSSHTTPTPRGGGVAIVLTFLAGTAVSALLGLANTKLAIAAAASGALVALLGFLDDRKPLPARWRFAGHLMAAGWVTWHLGPLPPLPVFGQPLPLTVIGPVLAVIFIVWSINLFNFMDGIDGIASIEAITVTLAGGLLWALAVPGGSWWLALLLAAATAGFLVWNFPPAKIFMGDAGSGFLGLQIGSLILWSGSEHPPLFWALSILYGCFMVDATVTLVRRVRRGEKFFEAHRAHAYQYASRQLKGHRPVTIGVGAINVFWLLPIAAAVAFEHLDGAWGMMLAYAPLVWAAFRLHAGDRAEQEAQGRSGRRT